MVVIDRRLLIMVIILILIAVSVTLIVSSRKSFIVTATVTSPKERGAAGNPVTTSSLPLKTTASTPVSPTDPAIEYVGKYLKIYVDKKTYRPGESVRITLINNGDEVIELTDPPWVIYKLVNNKWMPVYEPPFKLMQGYKHRTIRLKPSENISWTWNIESSIAPGTYVVGFRSDDLLIKLNKNTSHLVGVRLEKPMVVFIIKS